MTQRRSRLFRDAATATLVSPGVDRVLFLPEPSSLEAHAPRLLRTEKGPKMFREAGRESNSSMGLVNQPKLVPAAEIDGLRLLDGYTRPHKDECER